MAKNNNSENGADPGPDSSPDPGVPRRKNKPRPPRPRRTVVSVTTARKAGASAEPDVALADRIRDTQTHRVTPLGRTFIVECVIAGYGDGVINTLLRRHGFIQPDHRDLSRETLRRIRKSDDCLMSPELLTTEARQVGHNILSRWVVYWADLGDKAFGLMLRDEVFCTRFAKLSAGEVFAMVKCASDFMFRTFAAGLPERLRLELEEANQPEAPDAMSAFTPEFVATAFEDIMAVNYGRAVEAVRQKHGEASPDGSEGAAAGLPDYWDDRGAE